VNARELLLKLLSLLSGESDVELLVLDNGEELHRQRDFGPDEGAPIFLSRLREAASPTRVRT